jgi:hypothetical protein
LQAWIDFDEQVKTAGAFVLNGALVPAAAGARLVHTAIAGHALGNGDHSRTESGKSRRSTLWSFPT